MFTKEITLQSMCLSLSVGIEQRNYQESHSGNIISRKEEQNNKTRKRWHQRYFKKRTVKNCSNKANWHNPREPRQQRGP